MAGIYIHIPFCRKACHYCNFHFSTSRAQMNAMVQAICKEAALRANYINEEVHTVYFGGGTPSLLTIYDLRFTIDKLQELFSIDKAAEITLEANPDDITASKLAEWRSAGINRLSIGIQSFFEEDLQWMNRAHNAQQALQSIQLAQQQGFHNISVDLIYGTPTLSNEKWKQNVETAVSLNVPHLSCYALTVEPKTALDKMITLGKKENVEVEKQSQQFEMLMQWLEQAEYEHYEISNFAIPGFRSKHNSSYWQGKIYLGLGPSAHSFNRDTRQWNIADNSFYIKNIEQGIVPFEKEELTQTQQLNEYIMTRLRTMEGLSLQQVKDKWNEDAAQNIIMQSQKFIQQELMFEKDCYLNLTRKGKLLADGIAAALFA